MDLGDRLQQWWDRVRGCEQPAASPQSPSSGAGSAGARSVRPVMGQGPSGPLMLSVENKPRPAGPTRARFKEAGFNPYENTGGYRKPRGWDDVQRK